MSKSFNQLISQLQGEQRFQSGQSSTEAGMDIEGERQDIEEARSDYFTDVEEARRKMARKEKSRARRGMFGSLAGTLSSFIPGVGPIASALIGGLSSSLGRSSVKSYSGTISSSLPGGKFHSQARKDFSKDIMSTNQFISDANKGQSLLNMTNALSDAYNVYSFEDAFGEDIDNWRMKRKEKQIFGGPLGSQGFEGGYQNPDSLIRRYLGADENNV